MSNRGIPCLRRRGALFVVSAPSGTGKTSLCQEMVSRLPCVRHSVSYTTRPARAAEVNGRDYHFVEHAAFKSMIQQGAFLEWAEVYGQFYGTPVAPLRQWRDEGIDVMLDIDTQGAAQIRAHEPEAVLIYLLPPSWDALRKRLEQRGSDPPREIAKRLAKAKEEVKHYRYYKYVIINDDFKSSAGQLEAIIVAERCRTAMLDLSGLEMMLSQKEESC